MASLRRGALVIPLLIGAAVLGCKPEPPPLQTAKPTEQPKSTQFELKPPAKPAESDRDAHAKLSAFLAAQTADKPEALQKLKSMNYTRNGVMFLSGPPGLAASQTVDLSWPAKFKHSNEITAQVVATVGIGLGGLENWISNRQRNFGEPVALPLPKDKLTDDLLVTAKRQLQEDACFLLFPFADPATRVLPAEGAAVGDSDCYGLHTWSPALEYALLHIDKKTNSLVRLAFTGHENSRDVLKELLCEDHKIYDGVRLPNRVYVRAGGVELAEWRSLKVTSNTTFAATHFDNP